MAQDKDAGQEEQQADLELQEGEADEVKGGTVKWFGDERPGHKLGASDRPPAKKM
jgi:hypothetical protein